ncbi:MAG: hypothetical protein Q9172_000254 [Xanthocarpia lactea]
MDAFVEPMRSKDDPDLIKDTLRATPPAARRLVKPIRRPPIKAAASALYLGNNATTISRSAQERHGRSCARTFRELFDIVPEIAVDNAKGNVDAMADPICGLTSEDWYRSLSLLRYAFGQKCIIEQNKPVAKNVVDMVATQPQWFLPEEKGDDPETLLHTLTKAEDALKRRKSSQLSASQFGSKAHDYT